MSRCNRFWNRSFFAAAVALLAVGGVAGAAPSKSNATAWPQFRGPSGDGLVGGAGSGLPLTWSETEHVKWKTPIPPKGWSSPVVLGDQVWLTTASEDGHDFYALCVDATTGGIRFNEKVFHTDSPEPLGNEVNGYASPTPVIETGRVYIHFGLLRHGLFGHQDLHEDLGAHGLALPSFPGAGVVDCPSSTIC